MIDGVLELLLDFRIGLAAERHDGPLTRADDAGDDRHVVADDIVEKERGFRLIDQRGDVTDVDRLVQIDELAGLAQPVEELAKILLHTALRGRVLADLPRMAMLAGRACLG
jgi:hypothetical protein